MTLYEELFVIFFNRTGKISPKIRQSIQTDGQNTHQQIKRIENVVFDIAQAIADVAQAVQKANEMASTLDGVADDLSKYLIILFATKT